MAAVNVFVAERGNQFMARHRRLDCRGRGLDRPRRSRLVDDRLPAADGSINLVVAPHEFFELYAGVPQGSCSVPRRRASASTPSSRAPRGFGLAVDACRRGLLTLDISDQGVDALRTRGIVRRSPAVSAACRRCERHGASAIDRSTCCSWAGSTIAAARRLPNWRRTCGICTPISALVGVDRPIDATTPQAVFGADKYATAVVGEVAAQHPPRSAGTAASATPSAVLRVGPCGRGDGQRLRGDLRTVARDASRWSPGRTSSKQPIDEMAAAIARSVERSTSSRQHRRQAHADRSFGELALVNSLAPIARSHRGERAARHRRPLELVVGPQGHVAARLQPGSAPGAARSVPPVPADPCRRQAIGDGRERCAATTRRRGVRVDARQPAAHHAHRDAGVRRRDCRRSASWSRCTTTRTSSSRR